MTEPFALLRGRVTDHFGRSPPERLGVAVSGGSDSLALLVLLADWAAQGGPRVEAVTVDHGLRPGSAKEAQYVARICADLGVPHHVLSWTGWDGAGNLPDRARRARYDLMSGWARDHDVPLVAVAHTLDDQAETFLMRLAREAGVDGLSAMTPRWTVGGVEFCRPVLKVTRSELRSLLSARSLEWIDDPTNDDAAYDRTRARQALEALAPLGISARTLFNVARTMENVRETLNWYVFLAAKDLARFQSGDIVITRKGFRTLPREIARRLMQHALMWVSGADYAPRRRSMDIMLEAVRGGTGMPLHGCLVTLCADAIRISREAQAVRQMTAEPGQPWDGRWRLSGPWPAGAVVAMLGQAGLSQIDKDIRSDLPAASLLASPAVWRDDVLLAAPVAGLGNGWTAELLRDEDHFFAALLSH